MCTESGLIGGIARFVWLALKSHMSHVPVLLVHVPVSYIHVIRFFGYLKWSTDQHFSFLEINILRKKKTKKKKTLISG